MPVPGMTIHDAASETGWSPRMLRYIENAGLVEPERSPSGYRLYGNRQLRRLRALRELVEQHGVDLQEAGFALRLRRDPGLRRSMDAWLASGEEDSDARLWLAYEQDKHQKLLAGAVPALYDREIA
jgi:MerR family transcriptional regulator, copper efflux regulator